MAYDHPQLFRRIVTELEHRPRIKLALLCEILQVERHTVERVVRHTAGQTFRELQRNLILEQAKQLLSRREGQTIKQIACSLGYGSTRSFGRFFSKHCGLVPTKYSTAAVRNGNKQQR